LKHHEITGITEEFNDFPKSFSKFKKILQNTMYAPNASSYTKMPTLNWNLVFVHTFAILNTLIPFFSILVNENYLLNKKFIRIIILIMLLMFFFPKKTTHSVNMLLICLILVLNSNKNCIVLCVWISSSFFFIYIHMFFWLGANSFFFINWT